jgi:hypothetical protein
MNKERIKAVQTSKHQKYIEIAQLIVFSFLLLILLIL